MALSLSVGVISLSRSVYGKANSIIPMIISAQDGGGLTALVNARVNISVVAGLVAPPVFEQAQYYFTVLEDAMRGTTVGIVQASSKTGGAYETHPLSSLHSLFQSLTHSLIVITPTAHIKKCNIHLSVTLDHAGKSFSPAPCTTCTNRRWTTVHT